MKPAILVLFGLFWLPLGVYAVDHEIVEIAVSGLACPFCAYGLEKNLTKLAEVETATIDLAANTARVTIKPNHKADLDAIREAIVKAGFTPGEADVSVAED